MTRTNTQGSWPPTGFAARLKELRLAAGLTQPQVAERAGCAANTVSRIERGDQEPAWPLALLLARAVGVEIGRLAPPPGWPGAPPPAEKPKARRGRPRKETT